MRRAQAAEEADAAGAAAPAVAITKITSPTLAIAPSATFVDFIVPAAGDGISTVALSVITSTTGSSTATASPAFLIQRTISPSWTPSPMSGNLILDRAAALSGLGRGQRL
jgi:hypothetical protein